MHRARLLSAESEDGLSLSVPAHGATEDVRMLRLRLLLHATEDVRMLRLRLLNCIGDRQIAEQLRTAGSLSVCHDWERPLRVSVQFWEHMLLGLLAVTNGVVLPEPPLHFPGPQGERGLEKVRRDPGTPAMEGRRAWI